MKVLWFCNTPANGIKFFNQNLKETGGWMESLNIELQDKVELFIVFKHDEDIVFQFEKTTYYGIQFKEAIQTKIKRKIFGHDTYLFEIENALDVIQKKIKPDIIHIHGSENHFLRYLKINPQNTIISIQGNGTAYLQHFTSGLDSKYLNTRKSLLNPFDFKFLDIYNKLRHIRSVEENQLPNIKNFIGRTSWDELIAYHFNPKGIYFTGGEILRKSFYEKNWKPSTHPKQKLKLCSTLSNNFYKGLEGIYSTSSILNKKGINHEWAINGIKETDLINLICKKKLKPSYTSIRFCGTRDEKEIVYEILNSHIYVNTSHIENSPNSLCEAQILGIPVVSSNVGGINSLIEDKVTGFLYQQNDNIILSCLLAKMVEDWESTIKIGRNGRVIALKRHDRKSIGEQYINIYKKCITS